MSWSEIIYRPLTLWTWPETGNRKPSPFRSTFSDSLARLRYEVMKLGGVNSSAVLQIDVPAEQFRKDGQVFVNAVWHSPRVVLSLESQYGPLTYPCDRFNHWHDNVRAIALGLEALRKVDRYGITRRGEQYSGWKAISATSTPTMDSDTAAIVVSNFHSTISAGEVLRDAEHARMAIRAAVSKTHPDVNSGDRSKYDNVDTARAILSSHHGVSL